MKKEKLKDVVRVTQTGDLKNKKGITLVALVITIVILLILAGITITQLTGSGLFENARLAEEKSKNAQEKEERILEEYENKIGVYIDGTRNANANVYSTVETEIGTWIDGKKLYRKVYNQTTADSIDISDLNYDYIQVSSRAYLLDGSNKYHWRETFYVSDTAKFYDFIVDGNIKYSVGSWFKVEKIISIVEYTKK